MPRYSLFFSLVCVFLNSTQKGVFGLEERPILDSLSIDNLYADVCPFICSLTEHDALICETGKEANLSSQIPCSIDHENERFIIGNRTSIRRILPAGLKELSKPLKLYPTSRRNSLNIFLNFNILEIDQQSFLGLEAVLREVEILRVLTIHPKTFQHHRRLNSFIITSNKIPAPSEEISEHVSPAELPSFLLLNPEDPSSPISFNIDVRCHRCISEDLLSNATIIAFPMKWMSNVKGDSIDVLSLIYIDSCPNIIDGLGCPSTFGNGTSPFPFVINPAALTGWKLDISNEGLVEQSAGAFHTGPLTVFLVIWCSALTLFFVCLCVVLFVRKRSNKLNVNGWRHQNDISNRQDAKLSLKRITCQTVSLEELHQQSLSAEVHGNGMYETPSQRSSHRLLPQNGHLHGNIVTPYAPDFKLPAFNGYPPTPHPVVMRYSGEFEGNKRRLLENHDSWVRHTSMEVGDCSMYRSPVGDFTATGKNPLLRNSVHQTSVLPNYTRSQDGLFQLC